MKKIYMTPEMEILDTELDGFLAASSSLSWETEGGTVGNEINPALGRNGGDFDEFEDFEEDEF